MNQPAPKQLAPGQPAEIASRQRQGRRMMLAIIAVFVLPFFVLPLFMSPEKMHKTNKGILLETPAAFATLHASDVSGRVLEAPPEKKWALFYIVPAQCDEVCIQSARNAFYSLRQIPLVFGRDMDRIQSIVLRTAVLPAALDTLVQQEFSHLTMLSAQAGIVDVAFGTTLPQAASQAGNIYLMSPDGYLFIYYPPEPNEKQSLLRAEDIRSDLKKSLKGSRI